MAKITVYIPTYNHGKYLKKAVDSVLSQTYQDFELIIIDDASTDNTSEILKHYQSHPKIKILRNKRNLGFIRSAHKAIRMAKGQYILRLDADDFLDENTLLVLSNILDHHPEIDLVYPDFFHVNEKGQIIDYIRKKKIGEEIKLLDLPPNSGGVMMRKSCYFSIGGYRKDIDAQDKYDLWIKFIASHKAYNVNLPLYYYRWHGKNVSANLKKILKTRKYIKEKFIEERYSGKLPKVLAIIPTRAKFPIISNLPFRRLAGKPVIWYPIQAIKRAKKVERSIFVSENKKLLKLAEKYKISTLLRPSKLAKEIVSIEPTIVYTLDYFEKKENYIPDVVVILYITSPLITSDHIDEAINTLLIFNADSVISVREDKKFHYTHGKYGLKPLYQKRLIKYEKELLFEETGSLIVTKRKFVSEDSLFGKKISHIVLADEEAIDIENKFQFWLAEQILKKKKTYA